MNIKDPDVRRAIETLIDEFENAESKIGDLDTDVNDLEERVKALEAQVEEYESRIEELEEALAEAYLTSNKDDGQNIQHCGHSRETGSTPETLEQAPDRTESGPNDG